MLVYSNGGQKCQLVSEAFAEGSNSRVVRVSDGLQAGPVAIYGTMRGSMDIINAARSDGREWYYIDNGYFGRGNYFRVTRGGFQVTHNEQPITLHSVYRHTIPWQEWRKGGSHILVVQQSSIWYQQHGQISREAWTERVVTQLSQYTKRKIRLRAKNSKRPLWDDLSNCWAVVTFTSNVAVDAIVAGVPAFVTGESAAKPLALSDLSEIEAPLRKGKRIKWAATLVANQWSLDEMRDGTCWKALNVQP